MMLDIIPRPGLKYDRTERPDHEAFISLRGSFMIFSYCLSLQLLLHAGRLI